VVCHAGPSKSDFRYSKINSVTCINKDVGILGVMTQVEVSTNFVKSKEHANTNSLAVRQHRSAAQEQPANCSETHCRNWYYLIHTLHVENRNTSCSLYICIHTLHVENRNTSCSLYICIHTLHVGNKLLLPTKI
jgi:hypothetical protein